MASFINAIFYLIKFHAKKQEEVVSLVKIV